MKEIILTDEINKKIEYIVVNNDTINKISKKNKKKIESTDNNDNDNSSNKIIVSEKIKNKLIEIFKKNIFDTSEKNRNDHFASLKILESNGLSKIKSEKNLVYLAKTSEWRLNQESTDPGSFHSNSTSNFSNLNSNEFRLTGKEIVFSFFSVSLTFLFNLNRLFLYTFPLI